nr:pollen-specific leucine-rich repeat extensin-like protein 1 [Quercus suber]
MKWLLVISQTVTFLDLRFNNFHDKVPPHVFNLDVDVLFINNNYFYDTLPSNLGNTPALYLTVANNLFNGPIPQSIGNAKDTLVEVLFLGNKLDGCLPYEIGLLKNAKVFDVSFNQLIVSRPPITASAASKLRTHQNSSKLQQISELFAGIFTLSLSGHSSTHRWSLLPLFTSMCFRQNLMS